ncbi:MAG TPA: glycoside hydrolase family 9 protein [Pyrinomonadaceae bacterium]|nr:glycoside hydrolase family 9 protein [Pyrinomonadaceae bacterium]
MPLIRILSNTILIVASTAVVQAADTYVRINQAGYLPNDRKVAILMSRAPPTFTFELRDVSTNKAVHVGMISKATATSSWGGEFQQYSELNFTGFSTPGRYYLAYSGGRSAEFTIGQYPTFQEDLLSFMRQQRCGYNPFLDVVCHKRDGRAFYAPFPDETFVDASGGWHDAGDQLKYLITASNATARMILAYELEPTKFTDIADDLGREGRPNGVPDILDEAHWGLDWIHKLHPEADQLFHQVADDRDHRGFKMPDNDNADYGWGPNSYRPVYFADGKPQGLGQWKSRSTGVANIAGRSAAAMAMAYRVWKNSVKDLAFAEKCLRSAETLYAMGKRQEGFQQGNSFGAPYRYNEDTWADDMEYAAAELYKATKRKRFLDDARRYARIAATASWMEFETSDIGEQMSRHYEMYPFTNVGHFALYPLVDKGTKAELAGYYRSGIERVVARARTNPFGVGVPFLWCSNNLVVAFITQVHLYELMTGDMRYHDAMIAHRDWLFGRNPWGTSMFEGIPSGHEFPEDTHLPTVQLLKKQVRGGLVDGPIAASTYKGLIGIRLNQPDEFAEFQTDAVVYHDDVGDYATNEPTMDGTADAILLMALWSGTPKLQVARPVTRTTIEHGAITRGDRTRKQLALVFTGDEFAEGSETITNVLAKRGVKASFFFTGRFYRNPQFQQAIARLKKDGHYLGAHSDKHLLYADWNAREKTLVSKDEFFDDLDANYGPMENFGVAKRDAPYFLPPFEWYNSTIASWTAEAGLTLINFTPGTSSNADYTTPEDKNYLGSEAILEKIKRYESTTPDGLNGFILLSHIGAGPKRTDKFYDKLDTLIVWLRSRNYEMVRIEGLLRQK